MKKAGIFLFCILFVKLISASGTGILDINIVEENHECMINFDMGWNFFSFCQNLVNNNPSVVFSPIENKYRYVMKWDQQAQEFNIYSPKSSKAPIPALDDNNSYFIYLYSKESLGVQGISSSNELRDLVKGWNTPGYQLNFPSSIETLTYPIVDKYRYIMKWNSQVQEFDLYSPKSSKNSFEMINSSEGFFIYLKSASAITI